MGRAAAPGDPVGHYAALGLSPGAGAEEVRAAYKREALRWHPDRVRGGDAAKSEARFKEAQAAYEVLSDPARRRAYDAGEGDDVPDAPGGGPRRGPCPFSSFFDFGGGDFADPWSTATSHVELRVTLEELLAGAERAVAFRRRRWEEADLFGYKMRPRQEDASATVRLCGWWRSGTRVTFRGEGCALDPGYPPGDLVVTVVELPHPRFSRDGDDLSVRVRAWPWQRTAVARAPCGQRRRIPCHAAGTVRLRGLGMLRRGGAGRGDLIVTVAHPAGDPHVLWRTAGRAVAAAAAAAFVCAALRRLPALLRARPHRGAPPLPPLSAAPAACGSWSSWEGVRVQDIALF